MKKIHWLLFLTIIPVFSGCEYYVEDNFRFLFTGTVVDESGSPIQDIHVHLEGIDDYSDGIDQEILGYGTTDTSGNFHVVSLKSERNDFHVNRFGDLHLLEEGNSILQNIDTTRTSIEYVNVPHSIDFGAIQLRQKSTLKLIIDKISTGNDTLYWSLSYTHAECIYIFENGIISEEKSSCHEFYSDYEYNQELTPADPNFENEYRTILGGMAEFIYHFNNNPQQSITFDIDEIQKTYVFEY